MQRNARIELLRILSIFGIVNMHVYGAYNDDLSFLMKAYGVLLNSVANMGVTIFMLISGYFGIKASVKRYLKLEALVLEYSLLYLVIRKIGGGRPESLVQRAFPDINRDLLVY